MSRENVEIARRAHEAFSHPRGDGFDLDRFYPHADPHLVVDWSRSNGVEAGVYRGETETRRLWSTFFEVFDRVVVEPLEFIDHGDHVVVPHHLRAWGRDGLAVDARAAVVLTLRERRIVELRLYQARAEALKAVGLEEAMSQENVELVRRAVAALNARDVDGYLACCTEDVELHTPLEPFVGVYRSRAGIEQWLGDVEDAAPDFHIDLLDVRAIGGDQVLAFAHLGSTGRASGIPLEGDTGNVYDLVDGRIRRTRIFVNRSEALEAVGLEE